MRRGTRKDSGFPPWWTVLVTAAVMSGLAFLVFALSGTQENTSESERSGQNLGILLMFVALLPAWLSYFFANHGHDLPRAVAYCLGVALCAAGLAIALF